VQPLVQLEKWAIGFVTEEQLGNKPAWCGGCTMLYSKQGRCQILGPSIIISPLDLNGKKYTPVCSQQEPGKPMDVDDKHVMYASSLLGSEKADEIGLEWAEGTGTNCGGEFGAAICTKHFTPTEGDKGMCRPLQAEVDRGDCCAAHNGPSMEWRMAQAELRRASL